MPDLNEMGDEFGRYIYSVFWLETQTVIQAMMFKHLKVYIRKYVCGNVAVKVYENRTSYCMAEVDVIVLIWTMIFEREGKNQSMGIPGYFIAMKCQQINT